MGATTPRAPFLHGFRFDRRRPAGDYTDDLPALQAIEQVDLHPRVTFFVGENGSGKSTLVEALAVALRLNPEGGSRSYQLGFSTRASHARLHRRVELDWLGLPPRNSFFLRAESIFNLANAVEQPTKEMHNVYERNLHEQSHGESFLDIAMNRLAPNGLYLLDEPEAALSLRGQLALMQRMHELLEADCQFVVATHSPVLVGFPDARIYLLDDEGLHDVDYDETPQVELTRSFLDAPERFLRELLA